MQVVSYFSPPEIAERFGVDAHKVLGWIRRGELRALNVATTTGGPHDSAFPLPTWPPSRPVDPRDRRPKYRVFDDDAIRKSWSFSDGAWLHHNRQRRHCRPAAGDRRNRTQGVSRPCAAANAEGNCWPSVERIGIMAGLQRRAVQLGLRRLKDAGLIEQSTANGKATTYSLRAHDHAPPTEQGAHRNVHQGARQCARGRTTVRRRGARRCAQNYTNELHQ